MPRHRRRWRQCGAGPGQLGRQRQPDYILESILQPSAKIKENYHALVVSTDDGHVYSGIKVSQTGQALTLRDAEDRLIAIPRGSIVEQKPAGSLMPVGLVDNLSRAQLVDLVRFLSELGKVGPYALGPQRVVRRWQVLADVPMSTRALPLETLLTSSELTWQCAYSQVSGDLPLRTLPLSDAFNQRDVRAVRFQIDATAAGAVGLKMPAAAIRRLWIDRQPAEPAAELTTDLAAGLHTVTLLVDPVAASLRIELADVPGSPARAQPLGGK